MKKISIAIGLICGLFASVAIFAEETPAGQIQLTPEAKSGQTPESDTTALEVTINEIEGDVEVRHFKEKDWVPAVKGMTMKEGARISTGFKAKAVLLFDDNSTAVVKSLTQMTISRFIKDGNVIKTDLKLRIGSIRVKVNEKQPVKTDMKISTPNATASVRGTEINEIKSSSHFGDTISIGAGKVNYETKEGNINVQGGESTNQNLVNPLENALLQIVAQIAPIGLTKSEIQNLIIAPNLITDINSNTANPIKDKIQAQESSECFECQPCPECGYYPCICGGDLIAGPY
jgi:hypothetical protein